MSIPAPDLVKLTDEDVWVELHHGMIDSPMHRQAILTLRLNNLDRQTRASRELVDSADTLVSETARLADFTRGLRPATWVLAGLPLLLFLAPAPQAYVAFRGFRWSPPSTPTRRQRRGRRRSRRFWSEGGRRLSVMVETKQVYVPMEEWDIAEARKRHEAQWLSEGWRQAHVVSVPGKPRYLITLERDVGRLRGGRLPRGRHDEGNQDDQRGDRCGRAPPSQPV